MTPKQYRSIVRWSVVLALSIVVGFLLLYLVASPSPAITVLVAVLVLAVVVMLFVMVKRLSSCVHEEKDKGQPHNPETVGK